jgi:hypothetical protein
MTKRGGRSVPAHYGSAATELSVCVTGVGLADRSDLAIASLTAPAHEIDEALTRFLGHAWHPEARCSKQEPGSADRHPESKRSSSARTRA